jgi:hypothetical protein
MHHDDDMANCRDCLNHGSHSSMKNQTCHHLDQVQAVQEARYNLAASNSILHAGPLHVVSDIIAFSFRFSCERRHDPYALSDSSSAQSPIVPLRI